jgi:hypothetical protein
MSTQIKSEIRELIVQNPSLLIELVPIIPKQMLSWAISIAIVFEDDRLGTNLLAALVDRLPSKDRKAILEDELIAAQAIEPITAISSIHPLFLGRDVQVRARMRLAPYLPEPMKDQVLQEALQTARAKELHDKRAQALTTLIPYLSEPLKGQVVQETLQIAQAIKTEVKRAQALTCLIPLLSGQMKVRIIQKVLLIARSLKFEDERAQALTTLIPYLSEPLKGRVVQEDLQNARAIKAEVKRAQALIRLVSFLPDALKGQILREALQTIWVMEQENWRTEVLIALVPFLSEPLRREVLQMALQIAQGIQSENRRTRLLIKLIPFLSEPDQNEVIQDALRAARSITSKDERRETLIALVPLFSGPLKDQVVKEALQITRTITSENRRTRLLIKLIPFLSEPDQNEVIQDALQITWKIESAYQRTERLTMLAPYLAEPLKSNVIEEALQSARSIETENWRTEKLIDLIPLLSRSLRNVTIQEVLQTARASGSANLRIEILTKLVPFLSDSLKEQSLQEALQTSREKKKEGDRARALIALVPFLSGSLRKKLVLEVLQTIQIEVLIKLTSHLSEPLEYQTVHEVLIGTSLSSLSATKFQDSDLVRRLITQIPEDELNALFEKILSSIQQRIFSSLSNRASNEYVDIALKIALENVFEFSRSSIGAVADTHDLKEERVVNTGFAITTQTNSVVDPKMPLTCGKSFYFWLEVGPLVEGAIDEMPTPLPSLPAETRLQVALFVLTDGAKIMTDADIGELHLQDDGVVRVTHQPAQVSNVLENSDLLDRRLFFPIQTSEEPGILSLLCNIYCKQILIQSRLIQARVMRYPHPMDWALRSMVNYSLSPSMNPTSLRRMASHRLSLMLNSNFDNTFNFCFFGSSGVELFKNDVPRDGLKLQHLIEQARGALRLAAWGRDQEWRGEVYRYDSVRNLKRLQEDLIRFAIQGYRIYDAIIGLDGLAGGLDQAEALGKLMREPGLVQIALKQSPRYVPPIALIYDYPLDTNADLATYTLCPAFIEAFHNNSTLEDLLCFRGDCPTKNILTTICPSGFWGYRHCLGMPLSVGQGLDVPSEIVYYTALQWTVGVSTDKNFSQREAHIQRMRMLWPNLKWNYADTRNEILTMLKTTTPHLIYFYCHGGVNKNDIPFIQVGPPNEQGITRDNLRAAGIRWFDPRPLVFINGCHTTALEPEKAMEFVSAFIERAAAGVIGTEITIFEPLACAFAEECLSRFFQGASIGEAVRGARIALLQAGNPLGLVYVPFVLPSLHLVEQNDMVLSSKK